MKYFGIFIFLCFVTAIRSQEVEFTAEAAPDVVRVGEQFNLVYTSNQEFAEFNMPDTRDFQLLGGPSQGHSQSVSNINGKITTSSTYQYTYFFKAIREGKFTLPPAKARIKNKVYASNPVTVEVINSSSPSSQQGSGTSRGNEGEGMPDENDLFVRLIPDKREVYLGEQIIVTFKIYTKLTLARIENLSGPAFTGFFSDPIETPPLRNLNREAIDGDIYLTGVIRRMVIIPQKSGEISIEPFELDVALRKEIRRRIADPFFEDFMIPDIEEIPVKLMSRPLKIKVKPLPPNAPPSFKGAVGNFRLSSNLNKTETAINDPLTLKVTLSGKGNLKLINEVNVDVPYDMESYDPVINTRMDNAISGTKTFEYLIVPKIPGDFIIPPVEFTYFDTDAGQYKTLRSDSYDVAVARREGDSLLAMAPGVNKEDIRLLNSDIKFIRTKPHRFNYINRYIATSPLYYGLYAAALLLFGVAVSLRKKIIKRNADVTGLRFRRADKYARRRLKKSESLLRQGNETAFYEELLGAIWGYMSDKLSIPVSTLSKDTAVYALQEQGVEEGIIEKLINITETCEMARYGYGSAETDRQKLYHDAVKVITSLQQKLR